MKKVLKKTKKGTWKQVWRLEPVEIIILLLGGILVARILVAIFLGV